MKYVPINSLGLPWQPGQTWRCERCGAGGPDRDDDRDPGCTKHPFRREGAPHELVFSPPEHHAAIVARRGAE